MKFASLAIGLGLLLGVGAARGAGDDFEATLLCRVEPGSNRVVCRLDYQPPPGRKLAWADALVIDAPDFVRALRARVPAAVEEGGAAARAELALVGSQSGSGKLRVRARLVACRESTGVRQCSAFTRTLERELLLP
ncbi:MAG TPA: hypothetical protein VGP93_09245 [Polyangiaceae bacterium]|jgi:hypothetical protein|nr:hypothetical protein [Polyangiaceae bacterium]